MGRDVIMRDSAEKTIVIFGSSKPEPESSDYLQAYELGKALAEAGYRLTNGGYGGTMAAAAQGAQSVLVPPFCISERCSCRAGPVTIGVTCDAFGRSGPNPWIAKEIRTQNLYERLETLMGLGDAFIVLPGGTGTLLELAACWELINKRFLPNIPIICLTDYWKPVIDTIVKSGEAGGNCVRFADSIKIVLEVLKKCFADT